MQIVFLPTLTSSWLLVY